MRPLSRYRLIRTLRLQFARLPQRAWLTLKHLGPREFLIRVVTFPLRLTPWAPRLGLAPRMSGSSAGAERWYRDEGRPVAIVIPTYGDPSLAIQAVRSLRATTDAERVRIIVADDGSAPEHVARLRELDGIELIAGGSQAGFAANCNRGIAHMSPGEDLVLLNSDVIAEKGWLETLQHGAYQGEDVGIVGPKLLYEDGTIQSAGSHRNIGAPEWFDHRYRFKPHDYPPANVIAPCIAVTGAAMYVKRECLDAIGQLDEGYAMAYEDVDWCLKAWEAGYRVLYYPYVSLTHLEAKTRGLEQGERELESQQRFWDRWGEWFDGRNVRSGDGRLRVIYVTEDTNVGGGHRVAFQHLCALRGQGHEVELWSLTGPPEWFDLDEIPVREFDTYDDLVRALEPVEAIKVATWWNTAAPVWRASVRRGIPVYFVQDIETSYYPADPDVHGEILNSYRHEFRYLTTSTWNEEQLRSFHVDPTRIPPGLDGERFFPLERERRDDAVLALGRSNPLKNFPLTKAAWEKLPEPRPELVLFGIEPELADRPGMKYVVRPPDDEVNELLNTATVFVQTSIHEGFCLPVLEAMATGVPVVCTDADGNRDFCRDGENCLMPASDERAVADAILRVLEDPELRRRLSRGGLATAREYEWASRTDELERFFLSLAPEHEHADR
jgi:GT2 family glycosyltransferase/glycosyltransferase involved in cell wall biosynthesis